MASDLDTARSTIENRIKTLWEAGEDTIIVWPNTPTDPPDTGAWIQPSIIWGDGFMTTKNGRNQIVGVVSINIFAPAGSGTGTLHSTADSVRDMANRVEVTGVRFGAPSGPRIVPSEGRWIQANVSVPFSVEEVVT